MMWPFSVRGSSCPDTRQKLPLQILNFFPKPSTLKSVPRWWPISSMFSMWTFSASPNLRRYFLKDGLLVGWCTCTSPDHQPLCGRFIHLFSVYVLPIDFFPDTTFNESAMGTYSFPCSMAIRHSPAGNLIENLPDVWYMTGSCQ